MDDPVAPDTSSTDQGVALAAVAAVAAVEPPRGSAPLGALRASLGRWEEVRAATALEPTAVHSLSRRLWGFWGRTLRRVRSLGVSAQRESVVLGGLVEEAVRSDVRSSNLEAAVAELRSQVARLEELAVDRRGLLDAVQAVVARQNTLMARLGVVATRQDLGEEALLDHARSLIAIDEHLRATRSGPARDSRVTGPTESVPPQQGLPTGELTPFWRALEVAAPRLAVCSSIQVSGGGVREDEVLAGAEGYFGARLAPPGAANAPGSRFPHDAWIHVGPSPAVARSILLAVTSSELRRGGLLLMVTSSASEPTIADLPRLRRHEDVLMAEPFSDVRIQVWERT
jgi:hypothetical protein